MLATFVSMLLLVSDIFARYGETKFAPYLLSRDPMIRCLNGGGEKKYRQSLWKKKFIRENENYIMHEPFLLWFLLMI